MMSWPNLRSYVDINRWYRMLSWPNIFCPEEWKGCERKLSRPIWSNMWIRTGDTGWCLDLIRGELWLEQMWKILSWHKLKWYVDWKGCDRTNSRPIRCTMWIRTNDRGWCHDPIWCDMFIGTDDIGCCHDKL
jgi:hypothetical protein